MKTSESIKEIAAALPKAQSAIKSAKKDVTNTFFKSKYADLASVIDACRDALNAQGISILQSVRATETGVAVETTLLHSSGEWISAELEMPVAKADAQGVGSAITYTKRYSLQALVGVPSEDDDGNKAVENAPPKKDGGARQAAVDALASFSEEQRLFLSGEANKIIEASRTMIDADLSAFVKAQTYDNEEKLALWSLLPAPVRGKIKDGERKELSTQP